MKNEPKRQRAEPANRHADSPTWQHVGRNLLLGHVVRAGAVGLLLVFMRGVAVADGNGNSPTQLRRFIDRQVGGIEKLTVPSKDADLPQPRLADGSLDPFSQTTEAKRYLGKQLYFDPIRTARIRPEFGGVLSTRQTGSCGSCHLGEAASKAGTLINFGVGAEGRGYTDSKGNFIPRRRTVPGLPQLRPTPLFADDTLVDELCTLTDTFASGIVGIPGRDRRLPDPGPLVRTGRLDAVDSVCRNAPSMIGFAFNNRLLLGGFAGEPDSSANALNPFGFTAGENLTQLTLDAHRMQDDQAGALRRFETYRKLFRDAFPEEAAQADADNDIKLLINDQTVLRAMATFLRTVVTRNTPWDRFLAGDNSALTANQRQGARLFFTPATATSRNDDDGDDRGRARGAGCFSCHSGPMLNKQPNDPDVAGAGAFVEENFFNLGLADHPVQALGIAVRNDPSHRDVGRKEITAREDDAFEFRVLTLRQLKDGFFFFHNGSFTRVKDVVQYFNAGVPQDAEAAAASTFTTRFSNPRGPGSPRGLGLSDDQVEAITDFLENALFDPAFVRFDPDSTTDTFDPNERDLTYSVYRPDLAALGAVDGLMASGLARSNNDALSRRDLGLEFLDVTSQLDITLIDSSGDSNRQGSGGRGLRQEDVYRITNNSSSIVDTHLLLIARGLSDQIQLENGSGIASTGDPYRRVFLADGVLLPGQSIVRTLRFRRQSQAPAVSYTLTLLSGQGNP